jgi:hypothetical protein
MSNDMRILLSEDVLNVCLACKYETENLDFKEAVDLDCSNEVMEFAKDILAMANTRGGYILVGIEDGTFNVVGVRDEHLHNFKDGARINDKLRKYLHDLVTVHAAVHQLEVCGESKNVALICVLPSHDIVPAPTDAQYSSSDSNSRKVKVVFTRGDVFIRKADTSTRAVTIEDHRRCPYSTDELYFFRDHRNIENGLSLFQNPYNFVVAATSEMFKGRDAEIRMLQHAVNNGTHVSVFGLQRIGKTSFVEEALGERLRDLTGPKEAHVLVSINLQEIGGKELTYKLLFEKIITELSKALATPESPKAIRDALAQYLEAKEFFRTGDKTLIFEAFQQTVERIITLGGRRVILFVDEFSEMCHAIEHNKTLSLRNTRRDSSIHPNEMMADLSLAHLISSMLKSARLYRKLTWVFAVRPFVAEYDTQNGLQILKLTRPIKLYYLAGADAKRLIREPIRGAISIADSTVDYVYRLTAGHPYLIQFFMQRLVDEVVIDDRKEILLDDVTGLEDEMITQGVTYNTHFDLLDSDYSVEEVMNPQTADLGRGTLALISMMGSSRKQGWVLESEIKEELTRYGIGGRAAADILKKLEMAQILEARSIDQVLCIRMSVPLLRKRYVAQNMSQRYFRHPIK